MAFIPGTKLSKDDVETEARNIFRDSLPTQLVDLSAFDGKKKGYDDYLELIKADKQKLGKSLLIQSKGTQQADKDAYSCSDTFLQACMTSSVPVLLILVNIDTKKAYWEHVDQGYIEYVMNGKKTVQLKNTLNLTDLGEMTRFIESCATIHDDHHDVYQLEKQYQKDKTAGKKVPDTSPMKASAIKKHADRLDPQFLDEIGTIDTEGVIEGIKKQAQPLLDRLVDKLITYQALAYLYGPISIDKKGEVTRSAIRGIMNISAAEEDDLIAHMLEVGFAEKIGSLIKIVDIKGAKACAKTVVESGKVDINKLIEI